MANPSLSNRVRMTGVLLALLMIIGVIVWGTDAAQRPLMFAALLAPAVVGMAFSNRLEILLLWLIHVGAFTLFVMLRSSADMYVTPFVQYPIWADRVLGFGTLPTVWLQDTLYVRFAPSWWDRLCLLAYGSHFVNMWLVSGVLSVMRSRAFAPFMLANSLLYVCALAVHFLVPTAPPWLAALQGHTEPIARIILEIGEGITPEMYETALEFSGNDVAAMPSVHIGVMWLILLASRELGRWAFGLASVYTLVMVWSVIYGGEHYVVDALAGMAIAWATWRICWWFVHREDHRAEPRDDRSPEDGEQTIADSIPQGA